MVVADNQALAEDIADEVVLDIDSEVPVVDLDAGVLGVAKVGALGERHILMKKEEKKGGRAAESESFFFCVGLGRFNRSLAVECVGFLCSL